MARVGPFPALLLSALAAALVCDPSPASADAIVSLGTASSFAALTGTTVANSGNTTINGNVGVSPGTSITRFGTVASNGTEHTPPSTVSGTPEADLTTAGRSARECDGTATNLTGRNLGGLELDPGVYCFTGSALLSGEGTLTLNAEDDPTAEFISQIGSTFPTATSSVVDLSDIGGGPDDGANIMWQLGSSTTLGTDTDFLGDIVASTNITLNSGATLSCGAAPASSAGVTQDGNAISDTCQADANSSPLRVPVPSSLVVLGTASFSFSLLGLGLCWTRFGRVRTGRA